MSTDLVHRIEDLKRNLAAKVRRRRRAAVKAPAVLARLERIETVATDVARTLTELTEALPGLRFARSFGCGSRVLEVSCIEPPRPAGRRKRAAWTHLQVRLRHDADGDRLLISCRATACDIDLPTSKAEIPLADGSEQARAFVEECALVFAQALLARRRAPSSGRRLPGGLVRLF